MAENNTLAKEQSFVSPLKTTKTVQLRVVFIKIDDIRTVQEEFSGIVFIRARWREPGLDSSTAREVDKVNWGPLWDPKLDVQNFKGDSKGNKWRELEYGPQGEVFVVEKRRLKGAFAEQMELAHFPFDIQDLSVLITSDLKEGEIELIADEHDVSLVDLNAFSDDQEWDLHPSVWTEPKEMVTTEYTQFAHSKPGIYFKCCATRLAGFFVWNIMIVMSLICAMGFVTFAVSRKLPQNRIQLSFILVLASVTFKFAASSSVPKISYLTHLDRYILGNMLFTFLIAVWHGVVTLWDDRSDMQADLDWWAFIFFIILYVIIHIVFVLVMMFSGYRRRSILITRDQEYLAHNSRRREDRAARLTGKKTTKSRRRLGGIRRGLAKVGFV